MGCTYVLIALLLPQSKVTQKLCCGVVRRLGSWVASVIASFGGSYQTSSSKDLIIYIICIPVKVSGEILGLTDRVVLVTLVRAAIKGLTARKVKYDFRQVSKKLHASVFSYIKVLHTTAFLPAHSL